MAKVLVVDDSPVDRVLIEGLLKRDRSLFVSTATNGADALEKVAQSPPDMVVTDLQMPEMDGLELVTALRIHYPRIPVVLITAHGSEGLAIQALEQGAATYVPKTQLRDKLLEAVEHVLCLAQTDLSYEQLTQCMDFADFQFSLTYQPPLFQRLVEMVQQISVSMGICDTGGQVRLGMAFDEALSYMMLHGNYELTDEQLQQIHLHSEEGMALVEQRRSEPPFRDRKLKVACRVNPDAAVITISHAGPPLPIPSSLSEGVSPELEAASNRSLVLMSAFLDEVRFSPSGNELVLLKRRPSGG